MGKVIFNFHKSKGIVPALIRGFTRTQRFNHVSIELDGKTYEDIALFLARDTQLYFEEAKAIKGLMV